MGETLWSFGNKPSTARERGIEDLITPNLGF